MKIRTKHFLNKWIDAIAKAEKAKSSQPAALLKVYKKQLSKFYDEDGIIPIEIRTLEYNAPIYYLIFVATHPLVKKNSKNISKLCKEKNERISKRRNQFKIDSRSRKKTNQNFR